MKKTITTILITVAIAGILFFIFKNNNQPSTTQPSSNSLPENQNANAVVNYDKSMSKVQISAEKIEVIHFHGTHQCWSCITVGEYALKTIKEKFPEEYKNGTIVFREINGELPQNKDIVIKYQARGPSLFVNAIANGKDNIEEDVTVWRLVINKDQFINYFQNKLNKLLGK